jgi:flagellar biosynthesis chaperone FliJ
MDYIKVKDKVNLVRDSYSNGIVNTDYKAYSQYINTYSQKLNENKKIESMRKDIDNIQSDLSEIKDLLRNLLINNNETK